jgi:hypothetical protein
MPDPGIPRRGKQAGTARKPGIPGTPEDNPAGYGVVPGSRRLAPRLILGPTAL